MALNNRTRVLAIALDAAEPTFVRQLIDEGQMPALASLLARGRWLRVDSTAHIGSGTVWPTFITGTPPQSHGIYGEWLWNPDSMSLTRYAGDDLDPFWKKLDDGGISVGVLDVPFMPVVGLRHGFEVSEWGAHDVLRGKMLCGSETIAGIVEEYSPHPMQTRVQIDGPHDYQHLKAMGEVCLRGIRARGELARRLIKETAPSFAIVGFNEIHRSAHYLWHTAQPNHEIYSQDRFADLRAPNPALSDIFREVDRQIGELIEAAGDEAYVAVFSLHGMRPTAGTAAFLPALLCEIGFARMKSARDQDWRELPKNWFAAFKRSMPPGVKKLYYKTLPATVTHQLARATMLPLYDWAHTRAFSLPTDQHGWIRLNLIGREAAGVLAPDLHDETCSALEECFRNLRSDGGEPLVSRVFRTASGVEAAMKQGLPDLVIHWADAVFTAKGIAGSKLTPEFVGQKYAGQHALEGFCIAPAGDRHREDGIRSEDLQTLFTHALEAGN